MFRIISSAMVRCWLIVALLAPLLAACAGGADISVVSLEVTQATQTTGNTIQLVAQRGTAVRATIGIAGVSGPVSGVTGRLHVFVNGSEITPPAGVPPVAALNAPSSPQRANENDTLNFELPAPTGITASSDVDFRVDVTVAGETNTSNNSLAVENLTFVNRTTPSLFFTRIDWTPAGAGLPALADVQPGVGDAFVRGIYPVNDSDPNLYRQGLFPTLTYTEDSNGNGSLEQVSEGNNLLSLLASCRQLIVNGGLGASNNTFLYGWIAGNPIAGNGLGQVSGFNAYGNTQHVRHQRTYAHELGHNFGLGHNSRTLDEIGWDVGARLPGNPAGNNTTGRLKPLTLNDIMVGGQVTNSAWVDTTTYNFFLGSGIISSPDVEGDKAIERVLVVQGIFDPEGRELQRLEPAFRFPWPSQPTPRRQTGRFVAEVTDDAGTVTSARFEALVGDDAEENRPERFGFFEVMVAVDPAREVAALRILTADGRVLGGFQRSAPPEVRIVAPASGAELGERTEVVWEAQDQDTPSEQLVFQVAYSPDDERTWVPVAVDVTGKSVIFNSVEIQQSKGTGVIRVYVSDGLNTAFADVSKLTTLAAIYPPPR